MDELICRIRSYIQAAEIAAFMASIIGDAIPEKAMEYDLIHDKHLNQAASLLFEQLVKEK